MFNGSVKILAANEPAVMERRTDAVRSGRGTGSRRASGFDDEVRRIIREDEGRKKVESRRESFEAERANVASKSRRGDKTATRSDARSDSNIERPRRAATDRNNPVSERNKTADKNIRADNSHSVNKTDTARDNKLVSASSHVADIANDTHDTNIINEGVVVTETTVENLDEAVAGELNVTNVLDVVAAVNNASVENNASAADSINVDIADDTNAAVNTNETDIVNHTDRADHVGHPAHTVLTDLTNGNDALAATANENHAASHSDAVKTTVEGVELEVRNTQASELIGKALTNITSMLELPSGEGLNTQSLVKFDHESFEQFADILRTLERIGAMLDRAAMSGQTLNIEGMELTAEEAAMMSADLRIEKFHLQMGLSLIGAREIVSDIMAEKSGAFAAHGIAQAADPAELGMSALDTARMFSSLIEDDLAVAIERISMAKTAQGGDIADAQKAPVELTAVNSDAMRAIFRKADQHSHIMSDNNKNMMTMSESVKIENVRAELIHGDIEIPLSVSELTNEKPKSKEGGAAADKNPMLANPMTQTTEGVNVSSGTETEVNSADTVQARANAAVDSVQKVTSAFSRFDNEALIRQIMEKMQSAVRSGQGTHEIRMILKPEALGEVRMSIRVEGDVVIARMQVESQQVKAIVESNMQSLKDSLENQNLQAAMLSVDVRSDSDRSPQSQREMAEMMRVHRFRQDGAGGDTEEVGVLATPAGSDTGRKFGGNTFEYFI